MALKPRLGNAIAPEAPASGYFTRSRGFSYKCVPKPGLGNERKGLSVQDINEVEQIAFKRSEFY